MSRISIKNIINEELWTFVDIDECIKNKVTLQDFLKYPYPKKYGCKLDYKSLFAYFGFPFLLSTIIIPTKLILFNWSDILTSMSIFIGLLFNMLLILYDITRKYKDASQSSSIKNDLMKNLLLHQTYVNISFDIVIGILSIILILLFPRQINHTFTTHINNLTLNININTYIIRTILQVIAYGLIILFILHLFIIIKRVYHLLKEEFES